MRQLQGVLGPAPPIGLRLQLPCRLRQLAHDVLTYQDVETPGHPTHEARAPGAAFLRERLTR